MKRKIINIDDTKCNGCGLCMPDCPEGALQLIDGKARLVSDLFCDGLGACIGSCPQGAITVLEREAEPYNEALVAENIAKQGEPVLRAHLEHLLDHGETGLYNEAIEYLVKNNIKIPEHNQPANECGHEFHACPGSAPRSIERNPAGESAPAPGAQSVSELRQWPVQLMLLNPQAPYFNNADLLVSADCAPFAYGDFHRDFLQNKIVIMFCPKLDPHIDEYIEKMAAILTNHNIKSITIAKMEVPCCGGVNYVVDQALQKSGKKIQVKDYTISINGDAE
jgi:ferredoxin